MRIKIRTEGFRLYLPLPIGMVRFAVRFIPNRAFEQMRNSVPQPYRCLFTKQNLQLVLTACLDAIGDCKSLEVVHVEGKDKTFVSIKL